MDLINKIDIQVTKAVITEELQHYKWMYARTHLFEYAEIIKMFEPYFRLI